MLWFSSLFSKGIVGWDPLQLLPLSYKILSGPWTKNMLWFSSLFSKGIVWGDPLQTLPLSYNIISGPGSECLQRLTISGLARCIGVTAACSPTYSIPFRFKNRPNEGLHLQMHNWYIQMECSRRSLKLCNKAYLTPSLSGIQSDNLSTTFQWWKNKQMQDTQSNCRTSNLHDEYTHICTCMYGPGFDPVMAPFGDPSSGGSCEEIRAGLGNFNMFIF